MNCCFAKQIHIHGENIRFYILSVRHFTKKLYTPCIHRHGYRTIFFFNILSCCLNFEWIVASPNKYICMVSHTMCSVFHYETYVGISPYRTLAVVLGEMYVSYVMCDLIVWESTNVVHFSCDMGKYSTCSMKKVPAYRLTPYSWNECCIFPYRTQMNTDCISRTFVFQLEIIIKKMS